MLVKNQNFDRFQEKYMVFVSRDYITWWGIRVFTPHIAAHENVPSCGYQ
jgi:hypothetical protein